MGTITKMSKFDNMHSNKNIIISILKKNLIKLWNRNFDQIRIIHRQIIIKKNNYNLKTIIFITIIKKLSKWNYKLIMFNKYQMLETNKTILNMCKILWNTIYIPKIFNFLKMINKQNIRSEKKFCIHSNSNTNNNKLMGVII